jgi:hypothetical protein
VLGCLLVAWPVLVLTKSISLAERRTVLALVSRRGTALAATK